ncbi:NUDIX hydrolase [Palleronia abyssalis]|nr:NUDIX hydrolase [Palleronia abyssalis]
MKEIRHPIRMSSFGKRDMRAQFAALPWRRRNGKIEVLLVTTRDTGRWVIPKGWPMNGKTPAEVAATEAFEEAGVIGVPADQCLGIFTYTKILEDGELPVVAVVYPVEVTRLLSDWDEKPCRKRKWVALKKAAKTVSDIELAELLSDPALQKRLI